MTTETRKKISWTERKATITDALNARHDDGAVVPLSWAHDSSGYGLGHMYWRASEREVAWEADYDIETGEMTNVRITDEDPPRHIDLMLPY